MAERIIPRLSTPRSFATPRGFSAPGSSAPGSATATVWPAATLGAPQTMVAGSGSPRSTVQTRRRSAFGCCSALSTRPTRKAARLPSASGTPIAWIASTSVPLPESAARERVRGQPGVDVVGEPRHGNLHANCSRKRRSFSKKRRRSGTPKRIIAIRSRPQPKAKPV